MSWNPTTWPTQTKLPFTSWYSCVCVCVCVDDTVDWCKYFSSVNSSQVIATSRHSSV